MSKVKITLMGTILERKEDGNLTYYDTRDCKITKKFTDPNEFDKFIRLKPDSMVKRTLEDNQYINKESISKNSFNVYIDINAVTAIEWSKELAHNKDDWTAIDILTFWLQIFGNMRIRRALHHLLQEKGLNVTDVD